MKRYQYKTVEIEMKATGLFGAIRRTEGFEEVLNSEGGNGWRYVDSVPQTVTLHGSAKRLKLVFERETNGDGQ